MRRIICLLFIALIFLSACTESPDSAVTQSGASGTQQSSQESGTDKRENSSGTGTSESGSAVSDETDIPDTTGTQATETQAEKPTTGKADTSGTESTTEKKPDETEGSVTSTGSTTEAEQTKTPDTTEKPPAQTQESQTPPKATAADAEALAVKLVEEINKLRASEGVAGAVILPGLTEFAEYRSRQIISNFSHDTRDMRAAAAALQYGTYTDPTLYGGTGEPYYAVSCREAIANVGYVGTVDDIAARLAAYIKSSPGHWSYVGGNEYLYIGVGITYESGRWYCAVEVTQKNTDAEA